MTNAEALTRPDAWKPIRRCTGSGGRPWRVGRAVDTSGTIEWHRGARRRSQVLHLGPIITFAHISVAEARAGALNLADAARSRAEETT